MGMTVAVATDDATLNAIGLLCGRLDPELKWLLTFQRKPYHPRQGSWLVQVKPVNFKGLFLDRVAQLEVVLCVCGCMRLWASGVSLALLRIEARIEVIDKRRGRASGRGWLLGWLVGWSEERGGVGRGWMRIALSRRVEGIAALPPASPHSEPRSLIWGVTPAVGLTRAPPPSHTRMAKARTATLSCF